MTDYCDESAIVGVVKVAAGYVAVALVIDALNIDIEPHESFAGWDFG